MALFWAAIRRDSVSLLRFPFFSHVQIFTWAISLVCFLTYAYSYYYCYSPCMFFTPAISDSLSLSDSKSSQVLGTLLGILGDLKNAVVWMVSIPPIIFKFFNLFPNLWWPLQVQQPWLVSQSSSCCTFLFSSKVQVFFNTFAFFYFQSLVCRNSEIH